MYCGALVANQIPLAEKDASGQRKGTVVVEKDGKGSIALNINTGQKVYKLLEDIPEPLRRMVEEALREDGKNIFVKETIVSDTPAEAEPSQLGPEAIEQTLKNLARVRSLFDDGHITYDIYNRTVIGVMRDVINALHDDLKLNYVINEMKHSPFAPYIDDDIYNALTKYFVSVVSGTD
jgi:hypothetical protein